MTTGTLCPPEAPPGFRLLMLLVNYEQEPVCGQESQWHPVWPISEIVWPAGSGQWLSPALATCEATPWVLCHFWAPQFRKGMKVLGCTQRRVWSTRPMSSGCGGWGCLAWRRLRGDLIPLYNSVTGGCRLVGSGSSPRPWQDERTYS